MVAWLFSKLHKKEAVGMIKRNQESQDILDTAKKSSQSLNKEVTSKNKIAQKHLDTVIENIQLIADDTAIRIAKATRV